MYLNKTYKSQSIQKSLASSINITFNANLSSSGYTYDSSTKTYNIQGPITVSYKIANDSNGLPNVFNASTGATLSNWQVLDNVRIQGSSISSTISSEVKKTFNREISYIKATIGAGITDPESTTPNIIFEQWTIDNWKANSPVTLTSVNADTSYFMNGYPVGATKSWGTKSLSLVFMNVEFYNDKKELLGKMPNKTLSSISHTTTTDFTKFSSIYTIFQHYYNKSGYSKVLNMNSSNTIVFNPTFNTMTSAKTSESFNITVSINKPLIVQNGKALKVASGKFMYGGTEFFSVLDPKATTSANGVDIEFIQSTKL